MATYDQIGYYLKRKYGVSVNTAWIAHVKELNGLPLGKSSRRFFSGRRAYKCPERFRPMIEDAFRHFGML